MQVFKAFFKIIVKNLGQILIYIVVFLSVTVALTKLNNTADYTGFTETKVNIAFINNDEDSWLVEGLRNQLLKHTNIISVDDDTRKLQDALFFREVEYIVRIPHGFAEKFLNKEDVTIEKTTIPNSSREIYIDMLINKYLNTAKAYISYADSLSGETILSQIEKDLAQETKVSMALSTDNTTLIEQRAFFFNYVAYALFAVLILGVSSVMIVFGKPDLKRRNLCSPLRQREVNFQLIIGNVSFAVITWFLLNITGFFLFGSYMLSINGLLFLLNSLLFTFAALSISFLIGNVVKTQNAMHAVTNVVALGTSFISGVFVPQDLLSESVLRVASFTPTYWYVVNNNTIAYLADFSKEKLAPIFGNMLIMAGFTAAIISITLVITKQRRTSN